MAHFAGAIVKVLVKLNPYTSMTADINFDGLPSNNRLLATIPKGTKLLGVSIKDHICYLNFDEGLRNIAPGVSPETVIYSIVNSVIDGGNVSEVQISINGDSSIVYQESIKLDEPLSRNQEMIKED